MCTVNNIKTCMHDSTNTYTASQLTNIATYIKYIQIIIIIGIDVYYHKLYATAGYFLKCMGSTHL